MRIATRPPRGTVGDGADLVTDPDRLAAVLEDSAHLPGGHAAALALPRTEAEVAAVLRAARTVLPVGAQSSVTGGGTPMGEVVLSTARLDRIIAFAHGRVHVEAGVPLAVLQDALAARGQFYPPAPTYTGAFVGGTVATNAAGAATFKYGTTRQWIEALTVVLPSGDVLDIDRGTVFAENGRFAIDTADGVVSIPVPAYTLPDVPKRSAGYHAAPGMDLIDLFVGAEGTLGVITEITLRVVDPAPARCLALVACPSEAVALAIVTALREASERTWSTRDPHGLDVAAIEHMDRRSVALVREDGADVQHGLRLDPGTDTLLIVDVELPPRTTAEDAYAQVASYGEDGRGDGPLVRLCGLLDGFGLLDAVEIAAPGETRRAAQLVAIREAVPSAVNARVARAHAQVDPRISKTAADMIVPFEAFGEMLAIYRRGFESRGLDYAIWGHASDGNVHPNVIPRSYADVEAGRAAILEFGREVARLGGCPLAEHGVGRSSLKQALLRQLHGEGGIEQMRDVKRALDPAWKMAPGVLINSRD
jgi:D-lactate dehydrogenase (cytochrome)